MVRAVVMAVVIALVLGPEGVGLGGATLAIVFVDFNDLNDDSLRWSTSLTICFVDGNQLRVICLVIVPEVRLLLVDGFSRPSFDKQSALTRVE